MAVIISDEQLESIHLSDEVREKALYKAKEGYVMTLLEEERNYQWSGGENSGYFSLRGNRNDEKMGYFSF